MLSLALGIGVTTMAYSVVSDLFFAGLRIRNPESVAVLMTPHPGSRYAAFAALTRVEFDQLRRAQRSFRTVAASSAFTVAVAGVARTELVTMEEVSGEYFRTVGVEAALGRVIQPADEESRAPVAVLSQALWRERFSSDPTIIGRAVRIGGRPFEIVGVAPEHYTGVMSGAGGTGVWIPLGAGGSFERRGPGDTGTAGERPHLSVLGRPQPPATIQAAAADVATIAAALDASDPHMTLEQGAARVRPRGWTHVVGIGGGWDMLAGPYTFVRFAGTSSLSLGGLTLVLAMVGLYGIQSQGVTLRTREIGVRLSFGATAAHIRRMVLKDGYRPVVEGMAIGLFQGISGHAIIRAYLDVPLRVLDPWMLALVPIPLVFAAFCACYLPARRAASVDPNVALRDL